MKNKLFFIALLFFYSHDNQAQQEKSINLKTVIEEGLRKNRTLKMASFEKNIADLQLEKKFHHYFLPNISFDLKTSPQRIKNIYGDSSSSSITQSPSGYAGLVIKDYSLFNWGKDKLLYDSEKIFYERKSQQSDEAKIQIKIQLISSYTQFIHDSYLEGVAREFLRQATYLYRLSSELMKKKTITSSDYYQIKGLYLWAREFLEEKRKEFIDSSHQLAILLDDDPDVYYYSREILSFKKIKMTYDDIHQNALKNNSSLSDKKASWEIAKKKFDYSIINQLPLPKMQLSVGSYLHEFSESSNGQTKWSNTGGKNVELRAMISMSIDLLGEKGILNRREYALTHFQKELAQTKFKQEENQLLHYLKLILKQVRPLEKQQEITEEMLLNARKKYTQILDRYTRGKEKFLNLKDALYDLRETEEESQKIKLQHVNIKLRLMDLLNTDELIGHNLENEVVLVRSNSTQDSKDNYE